MRYARPYVCVTIAATIGLSACTMSSPTAPPQLGGPIDLAKPFNPTAVPTDLSKCSLVGKFLARNFGKWQASDILNPTTVAATDPTGLDGLFSNPGVQKLLTAADDGRLAGQMMTGQTIKGIVGPSFDLWERVMAVHEAVRVAHQHGGFLHMAMEVDCGLRDKLDADTSKVISGFGTDDRFKQAFIRFLVYEAAYTNAYIRNGNFGTYQVSVDGVTQPVFGKISDAGFVTRFGTKYQFQEISLNGTVTDKPGEVLPTIVIGKVSNFNYLAMESGFIRVFLEAVFDAKDRLPAVAGATGTAPGLTAELSALGLDVSTPDGQAFVQAVALPQIAGGGAVKLASGASFTIKGTDMSHLESVGNNAEAVSSAVLEAIPNSVAGFSIPAVHQFIQTAFAVTARKVAEKVSWCLFASGQGSYPGCAMAAAKASNTGKPAPAETMAALP